MTDRQKEALRKCGIPEAEWAEIEATDKQIDRGKSFSTLTPNSKREQRKLDRQTASPPNASQERRKRIAKNAHS